MAGTSVAATTNELVRTTVTCAHCGITARRRVSPGAEPLYCSRGCARRAKQVRRAEHWLPVLADRDAIMDLNTTGPYCIATRKVSYPSKDAAWLVVAEIYPHAASLGAYPCDHCTEWHIGNSHSHPPKHRLAVAEIRIAKQLLESGSQTRPCEGELAQ